MQLILRLVVLGVSLFVVTVATADTCDVQTNQCFGYTSTTSHFACNICPKYSGNCTWWAAFKRSDIAAVITGSGWNGGQWYGNLQNLGFDVGSEPRVGAIAEFSDPRHVAYVESANADRSFRVSEMDAYASIGFNSGVNYATYSPNSDGTYNRNGGSTRWTLRGFIYDKYTIGTVTKDIFVSDITDYYGVGWSPTNVSCENATNWYNVYYDGGTYRTATSATRSVCSQVPQTCHP